MQCDHCLESYRTVLSCGAVCSGTTLTFVSFDELAEFFINCDLTRPFEVTIKMYWLTTVMSNKESFSQSENEDSLQIE